MSDGITDAYRGRLLYNPPKDTDEHILVHVIHAMAETLGADGKEERERLYEEFRREHNLQPGTHLTPELRKALAAKFTDHIPYYDQSKKSSPRIGW